MFDDEATLSPWEELFVCGEHDEAIVGDEVLEIGGVHGDQGDVVPDAARRDPRVVLRALPAAQLGCSSQLSPPPGDARVVGDNGTSGDPDVEALAAGVAPAPDDHPLG